ncbi:hypothetical protein BE221DRAFT_204400 [Ostreococcus tauri]|uniref:Uncharacterized protein n=1 Tax=Ostreococcus tauri TaxID=70448 RepID=A0A1Y5ICE0_OSTTA|nr:hypothetical protein BE221DRAFT_204400 [Ostreococcus tauri]
MRRRVDIISPARRRAQMSSARVRIAVVGGGVAGLALASFVRERDRERERFHVTVFDTGERACGGRLSSKSIDGVDVDHGAQYFTLASETARMSFAAPLASIGALKTWSSDAVGIVRADGTREAFGDETTRYVGCDGFRGVATALEVHADEVRRPQWVGAMTASKRDARGDVVAWSLATSDGARAKRLGEFDFVVIAHNGKCAHRLASTAKDADGRSSCEKLKNALRCGFGVRPNEALARENKLILSSVWSAMIVFEGNIELADGLQGAHVVDGEPLSWVSNISAKRGETSRETTRVVLQSTAEYGRDNKVPQEAVPEEKSLEVMETLVAALEKTLGHAPGTLRSKVKTFKTQLWGAANPLTVCNVPCVLDLKSSTAAIGDWCTSGAPCVESAVLSAHALARVLDERFSEAGPSEATKRLDAARPRWSVPVGGACAQGGFPGTTVPAMRDASPAPARSVVPHR